MGLRASDYTVGGLNLAAAAPEALGRGGMLTVRLWVRRPGWRMTANVWVAHAPGSHAAPESGRDVQASADCLEVTHRLYGALRDPACAQFRTGAALARAHGLHARHLRVITEGTTALFADGESIESGLPWRLHTTWTRGGEIRSFDGPISDEAATALEAWTRGFDADLRSRVRIGGPLGG